MDMKSYILVGGGLLICVVLLHALVSAWRANRRVPNADEVDVDPDALDMDGDDGAGILWSEDAEAELVGEPMVEEIVADGEPGPPVLMESTAATDETTSAGGVVAEPSAGEREGLAPRMGEPSAGEREGLAPRMKGSTPPDATESNPDETPSLETTDAPQPADDGPEVLRKGRRIEIAGKRTEPTVPRAMRPEFHEFTRLEPSAGEREGEPRSDSDVSDSLDEVIVVWVFARPGRLLDGETLLKTFVTHGLKCDSDRVFKKTDPRCGGPWYAVANGVEPGTFDISRPAALETPGVVMLLNLGEVRDPGPAFEDMLDVAQDLAIALDAELKDEGMSDMSAQTIEHCRQRIRDHRRMLLRA